MTCREARDLLVETLTGRASPDVRQAVASHLAGCVRCAEDAASLEQVVAALKTLPDPAPPPDFWPSFMADLERRLQAAARQPLAYLRRVMLRSRRVLVPVFATAVAAGLFALGVPHPGTPADPLQIQVAPLVSESIRAVLPAMGETVTAWQAGLGAGESEPLLADTESP